MEKNSYAMDEDDEDRYSHEEAEAGMYIFARALSMLLYNNEGIVIHVDDEETDEVIKYIVYNSQGFVHVVETDKDLEEGEMVHMHNLGDINLN
jgi:hypothetical protein